MGLILFYFFGNGFVKLKEIDKVGEATWSEKMGTDCREIGGQSWKTMS